jgi:hypothetical protein
MPYVVPTSYRAARTIKAGGQVYAKGAVIPADVLRKINLSSAISSGHIIPDVDPHSRRGYNQGVYPQPVHVPPGAYPEAVLREAVEERAEEEQPKKPPAKKAPAKKAPDTVEGGQDSPA